MPERIACLNWTLQAKADATELLQQKAKLEKEKKILEGSALEKELALLKQIKTIGNYVHESVPISKSEVCEDIDATLKSYLLGFLGQQCPSSGLGSGRHGARKEGPSFTS